MAKTKKAPTANPAADPRVLVHDGFDSMAFESVRHYERIEQIISEGADGKADRVAAVEGLVSDVFTSFHRMSAQVDEEKPKSLTRDIVQSFLEMPEYKNFHQTSQLDPVASALGSIQMAPVLVEKLQEIQEQIEQQREEQREQNRKQGKDENEGVPQGEPSLDELDGEGQSVLRQAIREAIEEAQEEAEEIQGMMRQWGVEKGEWAQMDAASRLELADQLRNSARLKNVSQLIGRFRNVTQSALATMPSHGHDEITDITTGSDLQRMLPTEAMKLMQSPLLFYKDMLEGNLLQYNLKGQENMGKGPLMVLFDRSGSMAGDRMEWAVSVVLTLLQYAQKENRSFAWAGFDVRVLDSAFYKKGTSVSLEEKMRIAEMGPEGGTSFEAPLKHAMKLHQQEPDLKPADIVFITDGECELSEEFQEEFAKWKKEKTVRVFGVGIADRTHGENAKFEALDAFADSVCMVNSLGEVTAIRQVIQSTKKNLEDRQ